jgi:prepilin-type N-terminal cleavage/methylation domain-containing protein
MGSRRGFTLIEVILALTILLVVLLLLATSTGRTVHTAATASAQEAALQLAMDRVEQVRADPRYNSIDTLYVGTETGFPSLPGYTRTTRIVRVGGTGQPNDFKKITVTVTGPGLAAPVARTTTVAAP